MAYLDNIYVTPTTAPETADVSEKSGDYTVLSTEVGAYFELTGASGNSIFTLPEDPDAGFFCSFYNATTHRLTVRTQGDDRLFYKAATDTGFRDLYQALVTTAIHCYYIGNNDWMTFGYATWTGVAP